MTGTPPSSPRPRGTLVAALALLAVALGSSQWLAGGLRLDADHGDWRAASEGLYRSGQPGLLGAGRRVVVHLHGLDGRPGEGGITAMARPSASPVRITIIEVPAGVPREIDVGLEPVTLRVPFDRGTRDLEVRLEASALFRVASLGLVRAREARGLVPGILAALAGLVALFVLSSRMPLSSTVAWAFLAVFAVVAAWTFVSDPASFLRLSPTLRLGLRLGVLAVLWTVALAGARGGRAAAAIAIAGTVAVLHLPTVWYGFFQDDYALARAWSWHELVSTLHGEFDPSGMIPAYYRPVVRLAWAVDHALWGAGTAGYHATNLVLHAAAGLLLAAVLRRRLSPVAALAGALLWTAHPLTASVVSWVSARGDSLMAVSYLAALLAFTSPRPNTPRALALLALWSALALWTKEMAASLPLTAVLLDRVYLPAETRVLRRPRLRLVALVTAAYVALWVAFFAFKVVFRAASGPRWAGFEAHDPGHWLRLLPGLYAPLFLPTSYERWWTTPLEGWPAAYLLLGLAVVVAALLAARLGSDARARAAATTGVVWPLLTVLPLLGLSNTLDLYRLGYLVAIGFGFVVAALATRVERWPWAVAILAVAVGLVLGPLSIDAAQAWSPDGFRGRASLHWKTAEPEWVGQLTPEMQGLFRRTVEWRCHALGWANPDEPCP